MKVEGPNKTGGVKGPNKTSGKSPAGGASFSGLLEGPDEVEGKGGVAGAAPVAPLDALLALQGMDGVNNEENTRRAKKRGIDMLDVLDQVRIDLLGGGVPQARLDNLQRLINSQRDEVMDPQLRSVLDEIELRVQVELAKFSMK